MEILYLLYASNTSIFKHIQSVYLPNLSHPRHPSTNVPPSKANYTRGSRRLRRRLCPNPLDSPPCLYFDWRSGHCRIWAPRNTEDADVAVSAEALEPLVQAATIGRGGFRRYPDGTMTWDNGQFLVRMECLLLEGPFVPWVPEVVGFREGYKATLPELVRLRALTLVERGDRKDEEDLKLLLKMCVSKSERLPDVDHEELGVLLEAMVGLGEVSEGYFMCIINISTLHRYGIDIV
ncbi:hypothetical protein MMC17_002719 [Xylographa soralifera]|nr:hypothetical protein [Xylographa soralifera]